MRVTLEATTCLVCKEVFKSGIFKTPRLCVICIFQLREEKLQEEKTCEDKIHKVLQEDSEMGKRKTDEQKTRDEPVVLKTSLEQVSGHLGGHLPSLPSSQGRGSESSVPPRSREVLPVRMEMEGSSFEWDSDSLGQCAACDKICM